MTPGTEVYDSEECRFVRKPLPTDNMAAFSTPAQPPCTDSRYTGRPGYCDDASVPKQIRERAWTSPIWVDEGR